MTRLLIVALIAFVGSDAGPPPPQIVGPRRTADRTPTFRFVSHEAGLPARAIRFRCAIDRAGRPGAPSRYTPSLRLGRHTVRARAVDPTGRVSRTSVAHVSVVRPVQHADQTIKVGAAPFNVAAGFGSVWVAIAGGLSRLDPASGRVVARINVGGRPWGVAVGEGAVWVGVAAGGGSVWAADNSTDAVWRLDPGTGAVLGVARVGDAHEFVGFGEGGVWVSSENGTVGEIDPASGAVTRLIGAGADADFLGFSPGSVWVTNYGSEFLWRIDPATGAVAAKFKIGAGAQGVAFDGSSLWVAMYNAGEALRIDPATGRMQRRVVIGDKPRGLAIAAGSVWVANSKSGTVSRIRVP